MNAVDTNVLVYSEIVSSAHHRPARRLLTDLAEGRAPWAIPWPCLYEFLRVITHPRVFSPPVPLAVALHDLNEILGSPTLVLLSETDRHSDVMTGLLKESGVAGNLIHDAHIAALCIEHGINELFTGDRDFSRFPLRITNPFS
jgi:toxin-antitoxin system PIN domain toxin